MDNTDMEVEEENFDEENISSSPNKKNLNNSKAENMVSMLY